MKTKDYLVINIGADALTVSRFVASESGTQYECTATTNSIPDIRENTHIIISLSHRLATTLQSPVSIARVDADSPMTETELDNIASRALWKLFNQKRHGAGMKMKVEDIFVKVADADILAVKLDGHRVLDPIGFSAREVELQCQETLVVQPELQRVLKQLPEEQIVSINEAEAAWPLLARATMPEEDDILFVSVLAHETVLYRFAGGNLEYIDTLAWGSQDIVKSVGAFFGLGSDEANDLIDIYRSGLASENVLKKLEAVISQELAILFQGIEARRKERDIKGIFVHSDFKLPEALLGARYLRKLDVHFAPILLNTAWISEKFGYTLKLSRSGNENAASELMFASLVTYLVHSKDTSLSKIAKRRARWL